MNIMLTLPERKQEEVVFQSAHALQKNEDGCG
jgi:hypothetical protein